MADLSRFRELVISASILKAIEIKRPDDVVNCKCSVCTNLMPEAYCDSCVHRVCTVCCENMQRRGKMRCQSAEHHGTTERQK